MAKKKYYVNDRAQSNGDHEVHNEDCTFLPSLSSRTYLGEHESCVTAVHAAKNIHKKVNGCYYCCKLCHTQ